jgi:biopolymer transport protein ExbB/TolQ
LERGRIQRVQFRQESTVENYSKLFLALSLSCLMAGIFSFQGFAQEEEPFQPQVQVIEEGDLSEIEDFSPKPRKSVLAWYFEALGLRYTMLFVFYYLTAFAALILAIVTLVRRFNASSGDLARIRSELKAGRTDAALKLLWTRNSYLRRLLDAAAAHPGPSASQVMQRHAAWEEASAQTNINLLLFVGVLSMLTGVYGYIDGIIAAYMTISMSDTTPHPSELAGAQSMALVTVLMGQNLAWFCLFAWWISRTLCLRQSAYVHKTAEELLSLFQSAGQPKAG